MKTTIIAAPAGVGKTRHSKALAKVLGATQIVDEWDGVSELPHGALALTNLGNISAPCGAVVMTLAEALARLE